MMSAVSGSTAVLQGEIQRDQLDLNDWVTCVSAVTPKGKAEIQRFSGQISSAKQRIARIEASKSRVSTTVPGSTATAVASGTTLSPSSAVSATAASHSGAQVARGHGGLIDVWA
jgi:hypothetical protein